MSYILFYIFLFSYFGADRSHSLLVWQIRVGKWKSAMRMKKLFLNGAYAGLTGMVYCVVSSTSSLVAAEIPAAANSQTPVAIANGQSISDAELSTAAAAQTAANPFPGIPSQERRSGESRESKGR
jgi:hypothetical protein